MADPDLIHCSLCRQLLPPTAFAKNQRRCRECQRSYMADYRARNAEQIIAQKKTWYWRNVEKQRAGAKRWVAENSERTKANKARHYAANAERLREDARTRQSERRAANPDAARAYDRSWRAQNPEKKAVIDNRRRARKRSAAGDYSSDDIADIRRLQRDKCAICRIPLRGAGEIDHILALGRGGSNDRRNLQLLCRKCNTAKHARDPIDHMRSLGLLL